MDDVERELSDDARTSHCNITVIRCNGTVRLIGRVPSFYQKQLVTAIAMRALKGEELKNDVEVEISWDRV